MVRSSTAQRTLKMVQLAIFLALVIVLQTVGSGIHIGPVSISLTLIPIVLGGMMLGPVGGTVLGFAFGMVTLIAGITGTDAFTHILFTNHPVLTALVCLVKATAAGLVSALLFRALQSKHPRTAVFSAAAAAPIVNTGLFILGALFMSDPLRANFIPDGTSVIYFLVIGCAGINFIVEFFLNAVLSPALFRVLCVIRKK